MSHFRTQRIPLRWAEMNVELTHEIEALLQKNGDARATAALLEKEINEILAGKPHPR